jgi:hypothetical protein
MGVISLGRGRPGDSSKRHHTISLDAHQEKILMANIDAEF